MNRVGRTASALAAKLDELNRRTLAGWRANPDLVQKDAREEESLLASGYHDRQIFELVQNAADAAIDRASARVELRLTERWLYAANTGEPVSEEGLRALVLGGVSPKGGEEIGRFGLGFRSLLRLGGRVDTISAGVAFRFDPPWCAEQARKTAGLPADAEAPGMRLARPLDLEAERRADPVLRELLDWADTVVRAELAAEDAPAAMARELGRFPAEFLLFPRPDLELVLRLPDAEPRTIRRRRRGELALLRDGREKRGWYLFERRFRIDDPAALGEAGRLHARGEVAIRWAVPASGSDPRGGQLWNAFPTRTASVVPGILDTRWKVNTDRTGLTGEAWNAALMARAAALIAEVLPRLARRRDPGLPLALLPRQLERKDEPAAPLHDALWAKLPQTPFLASATGELRRPGDLLRPPTRKAELHERWCAIAPAASAARFVHPRCFATSERASRLEQLGERVRGDKSGSSVQFDAAHDRGEPGLRSPSAADWLIAAANPDPAIGRALVSIAAALVEERPGLKGSLAELPILPTADGRLACAKQIVLPGQRVEAGLSVLHPDLAADPEVRAALQEAFGIEGNDEESWLKALEHAFPASGEPRDPEAAWKLLVGAPAEVRARFLEGNVSRLRVKTADGVWRRPVNLLLVGRVIREHDVSANASIAVAPDFCQVYRPVLEEVGFSDSPPERLKSDDARRIWVNSLYVEAEKDAIYRYKISQGARSARTGTIGYVYRVDHLPGEDLLDKLSPGPRARLTAILLERLGRLRHREVCVGGRGTYVTQQRYPPVPAPHPTAWLLWNYGCVEIAGRIVGLAACSELARSLAPEERAIVEPLLPDDRPIFERWPEGWPTERWTWNPLPFPDGAEPVWRALLASRHTRAPAELRPLWELAARHGFAPESIPDPRGDGELSMDEVHVATEPADHALAERAGVPAVLLDPPTARLWIEEGAQDLAASTRVCAKGERSKPVPVSEDVPGLAEHLAAGRPVPAIVYADRLERGLGRAVDDIDFHLENDVLWVSRSAAARLQPRDLLRRKLEALAKLGALARSAEEVFDALDLSEAESLRAEVAAEPDLLRRLLRAAGDPEALRASLPEPARRALPADPSAEAVAQLCLDQHGPGALRAIAQVLERRGLRPPSRWGTDEARRFVLALGFPIVFAGAANPRLEAELQVSGPVSLPPLHPYQRDVLEELCDLLARGGPRRRAVLSLPTGAGKTRVAVEAAVRLALRGELGPPRLVWVAQTEELAEQAVEAFRQVWANQGIEGQELRIVRFWGGQRNPPESAHDQPTVVVSLVQTLGEERLAAVHWLATISLLVIDESHHAIAPSYTELLRGLGFATGPRRKDEGASGPREPALLGLTATPFRSAGEDETRLLAQRFDARVVPYEQDGLYERLREEGYLAQVAMESLKLKEPLQLSPKELEHFEKFDELPESVLARLSASETRNEAILSAIERAPERSILLFANTVDHAVELAARLSLRGIRARPVSGETDRSARRAAVAEFRRGEIRVIANAALFTTGFDAPSVDMILIARPVFSRVRFMQMVGRGLRGPRNGGTACCRIVTVRDNILGYRGFDPVAWWRHHYE
jgi:superfamily II DNA or RNA helicase